jgi:hypothetical protein
MKRFFFVFASLLIGIAACKETTDRQTSQSEKDTVSAEQQPEVSAQNTVQVNKLNQLVNLYEETESFPITISTKQKEDQLDLIEAANEGKEIPKDLLSVFDSLVEYNRNAEHTEVYATRRFSVSDSTIGLLTRVRGYYWPSKIILFLVNTHSGNIITKQEVADNWGDAGESLMEEAKLNKNSSNQLTLQIAKEKCAPTDESLKKIECVDSLFTYQIDSKQIRLLERKKK